MLDNLVHQSSFFFIFLRKYDLKNFVVKIYLDVKIYQYTMFEAFILKNEKIINLSLLKIV